MMNPAINAAATLVTTTTDLLMSRLLMSCGRGGSPPAGPDGGDDLIGPEVRAGCQRHLFRRNEPLQLLIEVLHDDEIRGRRGFLQSTRKFDHQEPLAVRGHVIGAKGRVPCCPGSKQIWSLQHFRWCADHETGSALDGRTHHGCTGTVWDQIKQLPAAWCP